MNKIYSLIAILLFNHSFSQAVKEINPPFHIKTISFVQNGQNAIPLFRLGDSFELQFDDLHGDEEDYFYRITHCDYDWQPSQLSRNEFMSGVDDQRIINYLNSFNALQIYSHYKLAFPNQFTQLKVSGNYLITILNDDREIVFSRKFILFEDLVSVPMQVKTARNVKDLQAKHNIDFAIKSANITFQSPLQNVKVMIMQNGKINQAITNIKPMFTIGNDLIYKYDKETQFWAGNEYLFFENKNILAANNSIGRVDSNGGLYNSYLFTSAARANQPYTFWPDINGNFLVNSLNSTNNEIESDYAWVYFSLSAPSFYANKDIYIVGMFNNYALTEENRLEYNPKSKVFEKALMIKQGFTNYRYIIADKNKVVDEENAIDGNFYQTENNYFTIVYYRENNQRYDRVIGKGSANSVDIIN